LQKKVCKISLVAIFRWDHWIAPCGLRGLLHQRILLSLRSQAQGRERGNRGWAAASDRQASDLGLHYEWEDLEQVQDHATRWMWSYNHERPNMALGGLTPKQRLAMVASVSTSAAQ